LHEVRALSVVAPGEGRAVICRSAGLTVDGADRFGRGAVVKALERVRVGPVASVAIDQRQIVGQRKR
jgi:hypothetical protein